MTKREGCLSICVGAYSQAANEHLTLPFIIAMGLVASAENFNRLWTTPAPGRMNDAGFHLAREKTPLLLLSVASAIPTIKAQTGGVFWAPRTAPRETIQKPRTISHPSNCFLMILWFWCNWAP
jgi:hypothetical protein